MANDGQISVELYLHDTHRDEFRDFVDDVVTSKELIDSTQHKYIEDLSKVCQENVVG